MAGHGRRLAEPSPEPVTVQALQQLPEALVLPAHDAPRRHPHIVEEGFVVVDLAGEADDGPQGEAGGVVGDHEHGEATGPAARLSGAGGAGQHHPVGAGAGLRAPDLVSVDVVLVAVAPGPAGEGEEVGAGIGLAVALPGQGLAGGDAGQEVGLEGGVALPDQRLGPLVAAGQRAERGASQCQLLHQGELVDHGALGAAESAGPGEPDPAPGTQRPQEIERVGPGAVAAVHGVLGPGVGRSIGQEGTHLGPQRLGTGRVAELHARSPCARSPGPVVAGAAPPGPQGRRSPYPVAVGPTAVTMSRMLGRGPTADGGSSGRPARPDGRMGP